MANKYPEIFVLRHGQTEWNYKQRFQGSLNSDLTDLGKTHAAQQGEILRFQNVVERGFQMFSSPQGRVQQTATIVSEILGCSHQSDPRLAELTQGAWEGLYLEDIKTGWPDAYAKRTGDIRWFFSNPTGETFESLQARATTFLESLKTPSVIVTHGVTSHILRGIWLGLDLDGAAALEGGQGCVYHLRDGQHVKLEP